MVVPLERGDARAEVEADAVLLVPPLQDGREQRPERADHGQPVDRDTGDIAAEGAGGGGDLAADEAGAEHDDAGAGPQLRAQRECVVERPDDVPPRVRGGRRTGDVEAAGGDAGGRDERVVLQGRAVGELDLTAAEVGPDDAGAEPPDDVRCRLAHPEGEPLVREPLHELAGQRLLGERRAVVRGVRLVAEDDDLAREALRTQRLGGAQARHARTDDDHALTHRASALSALDRDRLHRADVGSLLDGVAQVLADVVLQLHELAVVVQLEDLRRREDALPVVLADVAVDPHVDQILITSPRRGWGTGPWTGSGRRGTPSRRRARWRRPPRWSSAARRRRCGPASGPRRRGSSAGRGPRPRPRRRRRARPGGSWRACR